MSISASFLLVFCSSLFFGFCEASEAHHAACPDDAWQDGLPFVQCDRTPPCVRWNWANPQRCSQMRLDRDWPTWDPWIHRNHSWANARELMQAHLKDKTLLLVGDSITNLVYHGLVCEVARHGLTVITSHQRLRDFELAFHAIPIDMWVGQGVPHQYVYVEESNSIIAHKGWAKPSRTDTEALLSIADVVVINYGLHYHNMSEYAEDMDALLSQMRAFNEKQGKRALFREISAQAFDGTGSYVPGAERGAGCAPTPPDKAYDNFVVQQNKLIHQIAREYDVDVVPFYDTTLPRWNMREERFCEIEGRRNNPDTVCCDCTHLCVTPTLWAQEVDVLETYLR
jgi:hypothetical protein